MPESYFHVRCAKETYRKSGLRGYDAAAMTAGSAGPDPLFYYLGLPPLVPLGRKMHARRCGEFLSALAREAKTPAERAYALGFFSHNAADAVLHPWIAAQTEAHAALEQEIDSLCLLRDKGRGAVEREDCAVRLSRERALELGRLFSRCVEEVYGTRVTARAFAKALGDLYRCKGWLRDPGGRKARVAGGFERALRLRPGTVAGHLVTGAAPRELSGLDEPVRRAEELAADMMAAAGEYWAGRLGPLELARRLGDRNYLTGEQARADT